MTFQSVPTLSFYSSCIHLHMHTKTHTGCTQLVVYRNVQSSPYICPCVFLGFFRFFSARSLASNYMSYVNSQKLNKELNKCQSSWCCQILSAWREPTALLSFPLLSSLAFRALPFFSILPNLALLFLCDCLSWKFQQVGSCVSTHWPFFHFLRHIEGWNHC